MKQEDLMLRVEQEREKYGLEEVGFQRLSTMSGQEIGNIEIKEADVLYQDTKSSLVLSYRDGYFDAPKEITANGHPVDITDERALIQLESEATPGLAAVLKDTLHTPEFKEMQVQVSYEQSIQESIEKTLKEETVEQSTQQTREEEQAQNQHSVVYTPNNAVELHEVDTGSTSKDAAVSVEKDEDEIVK